LIGEEKEYQSERPCEVTHIVLFKMLYEILNSLTTNYAAQDE